MTADSPHGNVAVDWHGAQDIAVRIRCGTLKLVGSTDDQVAAEISAALATAMRRHSAHVVDIHRDVYRSSRITTSRTVSARA